MSAQAMQQSQSTMRPLGPCSWAAEHTTSNNLSTSLGRETIQGEHVQAEGGGDPRPNEAVTIPRASQGYNQVKAFSSLIVGRPVCFKRAFTVPIIIDVSPGLDTSPTSRPTGPFNDEHMWGLNFTRHIQGGKNFLSFSDTQQPFPHAYLALNISIPVGYHTLSVAIPEVFERFTNTGFIMGSGAAMAVGAAFLAKRLVSEYCRGQRGASNSSGSVKATSSRSVAGNPIEGDEKSGHPSLDHHLASIPTSSQMEALGIAQDFLDEFGRIILAGQQDIIMGIQHAQPPEQETISNDPAASFRLLGPHDVLLPPFDFSGIQTAEQTGLDALELTVRKGRPSNLGDIVQARADFEKLVREQSTRNTQFLLEILDRHPGDFGMATGGSHGVVIDEALRDFTRERDEELLRLARKINKVETEKELLAEETMEERLVRLEAKEQVAAGEEALASQLEGFEEERKGLQDEIQRLREVLEDGRETFRYQLERLRGELKKANTTITEHEATEETLYEILGEQSQQLQQLRADAEASRHIARPSPPAEHPEDFCNLTLAFEQVTHQCEVNVEMMQPLLDQGTPSYAGVLSPILAEFKNPFLPATPVQRVWDEDEEIIVASYGGRSPVLYHGQGGQQRLTQGPCIPVRRALSSSIAGPEKVRRSMCLATRKLPSPSDSSDTNRICGASSGYRTGQLDSKDDDYEFTEALDSWGRMFDLHKDEESPNTVQLANSSVPHSSTDTLQDLAEEEVEPTSVSQVVAEEIYESKEVKSGCVIS